MSIFTNKDLDAAHAASEENFLLDGPPLDGITEKLAAIWTYREVWGSGAAERFAAQVGITYQAVTGQQAAE